VITVVAGVIEEEGKILIAQRRSGSLAGKWEFPGGKVRDGESPGDALKREFQEELNVSIEVGDLIDEVLYAVDDTQFNLMAFKVRHVYGYYYLHDHDNMAWVKPEQLANLDLAPPDSIIAMKIEL
jgi:8-oxo-dGTP diphosphatase